MADLESYIGRVDYGGKCWWCGGQADSREHKYKRSDLVRMYGSGSYRGDAELLRITDGNHRVIQGPNSKLLKFEPTLCRKCNNQRSQPADLAYQELIDYVGANRELVLQSNSMVSRAVFGDDWETRQFLFAAYVVKHAASRIAESGLEVRWELREFLDGATDLRTFGIRLEIREDIVELEAQIGRGGLWIGDLLCIMHEPSGSVRQINSHYGYGWLRIIWEHDLGIPNWAGFGPEITLTRDFNVSPASIRARAAGADDYEG